MVGVSRLFALGLALAVLDQSLSISLSSEAEFQETVEAEGWINSQEREQQATIEDAFLAEGEREPDDDEDNVQVKMLNTLQELATKVDRIWGVVHTMEKKMSNIGKVHQHARGRHNHRQMGVAPLKENEVRITCDNQIAEMYVNSERMRIDPHAAAHWPTSNTVRLPNNTRTVAVMCLDRGVVAGLVAVFASGRITDDSWKCTTQLHADWMNDDFDDSDWPAAVVQPYFPAWNAAKGFDQANWIWTKNKSDPVVYCRLNI